MSKLAGAKVGPEALHSTIGRCAVLYDELNTQWQALMDNIAKGDLNICTHYPIKPGESRASASTRRPGVSCHTGW